MSFPGFSPRDLEYIQLRAQGAKPKDIAELWGSKLNYVYWVGRTLRKRIGMPSDNAAMVAWAREWGLDVALGPETSATRPRPGMPKKRRSKIRLRRIYVTSTRSAL